MILLSRSPLVFFTFLSLFFLTTVTSESPADRAKALIVNMTLEEKITLMYGIWPSNYTGATAPIPRLNIPALYLNDGRQGFRPNDGSPTQSAFPCELAVVATFRRSMYYNFGRAMGQEFYGKGANVILAPMLILTRVPLDGRAFESVGEDPELAYNFAYNTVTGQQSVPGIITNADDYVLNNQEYDRTSISAVCDRRTLFEVYYRGYKGAVDAGVGSVMCSYNRINGTYACENNVTLGDLKNPQGLNFTGWVLSDWGGTHSTVQAALAGLDQEMPDSYYFNSSLYNAVIAGQVPESVIDDKALRILTPMFRAGLFDLLPPTGNQNTNVNTTEHAALAREMAGAGTVLLSNPKQLLPLSGSTIRTIAVIGDDGDVDPRCCGTGSGALYPPYLITPFQGISERGNEENINTSYFPSPSVPLNITQFYSAERGDHFLDFTCDECGSLYDTLRNEGYAFPYVSSTPPFPECIALLLYYDTTAQSNLLTTADYPPPESSYAYVRQQAWILPLNYTGTATVTKLELWRGHDTPTGQPPLSHLDYFTLATNASRQEAINANYTKYADLGYLLLDATGSPNFNSTVQAAVNADIAIVCVSTPSGEGTDRTDLNLAPEDELLVSAIMNAQPNTIIVLHNPGAVVMPWANNAGAILAAWFPGQEMGNALADILFGDVNPSGRLPLTFPVLNTDTPMQTPEQYPGVNGTVTYTEKLNIGYRWFDSQQVAPLFPFGHGLSYTTFTYTNLVIDTTTYSPNVHVTCTVTNTGSVVGTEIAQLYLGFPASADEPPKVLRGFTDLENMAPNQSFEASFTLVPRDMSIWDVDNYQWSLVSGEFTVYVGASSRDIRLQNTFTL